MRYLFDFEIHSQYSRACSKALTLPNIENWAERKGIQIIGTGDFTHPRWLSHIQECLQEQENGLLTLKPEFQLAPRRLNQPVQFILSAEISCIYSHNGKTRRIHNLLLAPSLDAVKGIITALESRGAKLASDGRPIIGMSSKALLELVLSVSPDCMMIPAHVWTPYFGLFGSMSGYDSIAECFEDMTPYIYALETGLSADPEMFWRISALDTITLVSCSDAHSLARIGRECNVFELPPEEVSYKELTRIIKERDTKKFITTLEYYPEEGKYHYDGHRDCKLSFHPSETKKLGSVCPVCGKKLTIGVLARVEELADRPLGYVPEQMILGGKPVIPGRHFVVLEEILAAAMQKAVSSKAVQLEYLGMTSSVTEYQILFEASESELLKLTRKSITEAILKMRQGHLEIIPGFDGEYGKIKMFETMANQDIPTLF